MDKKLSNPLCTSERTDFPGYFQVVFDSPWQLEIDGQRTTFEFDENQLCDLGEVVGKHFSAKEKAFCRNTFTLPQDGKVVFGMGCDWFLACRIDGEEILNNFNRGNVFYPIATSNYVYELDLKAGNHEVELEAMSGDVSFLLAFGNVLPCDPSFVREPFLTDIGPGTITVSFATRSCVPSGVDYRMAGSSEWKRIWHAVGGQKYILNPIHRIRIEGLAPDTVYEYRLAVEHPYRGFRELYSPVRTFRSAPAEFKPFRVLLVSDTQGAWEDRERRIRKVIGQPAFARADLLGHLGDYSDSSENFERSLFGGLFELYNGKPMLIVRGNHEYPGNQSALWFEYFGSAMKLTQYGDVVFLSLDCGNGEWLPPPNPQSINDPEPYWEEQRVWLEKALQSEAFQKARFRIVLAHGMPFGDPDPYEFMGEHLRKMIDPYLAGNQPAFSIDLWIAGHIHIPIRTVPGQNAIISRAVPRPQPAVGTRYHFPIAALSGPLAPNPEELRLTAMELEFAADKFTVTSRDLNGDVYDSFEIGRGGRLQETFLREDFKVYPVPAR